MKHLIDYSALVTPNKGKNAGREMTLINGKFWSRQSIPHGATHIVVEETDDGFFNVQGFARDSNMSINSKIDIVKANPEVAVALATLLK